jgi:hypothetical protein
MLIDRDDLYMQQDSFLVDVEDISNRIQEYAARLKISDNISEQKSITKSNSPVKKVQKENNNSNGNSSRLSKLTQFNNILTSKLYQFSRKSS